MPSGPRTANQLKTVFELLVSSYNEIGEKDFYCLFERYPVDRELVILEVVFKLTRLESIPPYQSIRPSE
jgi:hypothetical protein